MRSARRTRPVRVLSFLGPSSVSVAGIARYPASATRPRRQRRPDHVRALCPGRWWAVTAAVGDVVTSPGALLAPDSDGRRHMVRLKAAKPRLQAAPQRAWASQGTGSSRGYGAQWQRVRDQVMVRDGGLCQPCQRHGVAMPAREVDHIVPRSQWHLTGSARDDVDGPANLQAICRECHKAKSGPEKAGRRWDENAWFRARGVEPIKRG